MPHRLIRRRRGLYDYIVYTDASPNVDSRTGGLTYAASDPESYRNTSSIRAEYVVRSNFIDPIVRMFIDQSPIIGIELDEVIISICLLRYF